ncbi:MAG: restriction endonuclease [Fervidobacterium sp.]|uniref:restriction endonuclease n=1 Tax=Fervidobacterium sp. TaxID=1871331 RepID=UPI0034353B19|nr:restriction endonuclease [Fervidobacterium sp.]
MKSFVGALHGKGARKGIFITTASFTKEALQYAENIKDIKVVLIDGDKLLDYMIKYNLGVRVDSVIEIKKIDSDYFEEE